LRSIIGVYHLIKASTDAKIEALYAAGQRKISVVLWHWDSPYEYPNNMWCISIVTKGILPEQQQTNLRELMMKIKQAGSDKIDFRFAPDSPTAWTEWREDEYQSDWNVIVNTRELIYDSLATVAGPSPRVLFDLAVEHAGTWAIPWETDAAQNAI